MQYILKFIISFLLAHSIIYHCLSVSCTQINHSRCALVICSALQQTQQFTTRADLFLKFLSRGTEHTHMQYEAYSADLHMSFSAVGQHGAVRHRDPTMRHLMKLKEECQEKDIPAFVTEGIDKAMALFQVWHCLSGLLQMI